MKILFLAAFAVCAMSASVPSFSSGPRWPRLPLDVVLRGHFQPKAEQDEKIVGGDIVVPNSLPFQVSMQRKSLGAYSQYCGGSILSENVILDAAHCVDGINVDSFRIVAGEHDLNVDSGKEQVRGISRYVQHESYGPITVRNDISLIFLDAPLDLTSASSAAKAIDLPVSGTQTAAGTPLVVSGWGTTRAGGQQTSDLLRSVEVPVVSDADCRAAYGENSITDSMICAGLTEGGKDSCQGDSGGPLFKNESGKFTLIGIVSWGQGCAEPKFPGVYTEVSYFIDWITANNKP